MLIISGVFMAFNLLIILHKLRKFMILNALVDLLFLGIIVVLTAGTYSGLATGMIASTIVSGYLWFYPLREPKLIRKMKNKIKGKSQQ